MNIEELKAKYPNQIQLEQLTDADFEAIISGMKNKTGLVNVNNFIISAASKSNGTSIEQEEFNQEVQRLIDSKTEDEFHKKFADFERLDLQRSQAQRKEREVVRLMHQLLPHTIYTKATKTNINQIIKWSKSSLNEHKKCHVVDRILSFTNTSLGICPVKEDFRSGSYSPSASLSGTGDYSILYGFGVTILVDNNGSNYRFSEDIKNLELALEAFKFDSGLEERMMHYERNQPNKPDF